MTVRDFQEMINRVLFCAVGGKDASFGGMAFSKGEVREKVKRELFCAKDGDGVYFRGVMLKKEEGKLIMAATNSQQFGVAMIDVGDAFTDFDAVVVSLSFLQKIDKLKCGTSNLVISVSDKAIIFTISGINKAMDLVSVRFPQYRTIPKNFSCYTLPFSFTVNRKNLVRRCFESPWGIFGSSFFDFSPEKVVCLYLSQGKINLKNFKYEDYKRGKAASDDSGDFLEYLENSSHNEYKNEYKRKVISTKKSDVTVFFGVAPLPCDYFGENKVLMFYPKQLGEILNHIDTEKVSIRFDADETIAVIPVPEQGYHFFLTQTRWGIKPTDTKLIKSDTSSIILDRNEFVEQVEYTVVKGA